MDRNKDSINKNDENLYKYTGVELCIATYKCVMPQWYRYTQQFPETYANGYL